MNLKDNASDKPNLNKALTNVMAQNSINPFRHNNIKHGKTLKDGKIHCYNGIDVKLLKLRLTPFPYYYPCIYISHDHEKQNEVGLKCTTIQLASSKTCTGNEGIQQ